MPSIFSLQPSCFAISVTLPRKVTEIITHLDADYKLKWRKSQVFSMSLSASKSIKQDNHLTVNTLPKRFKTHVFW